MYLCCPLLLWWHWEGVTQLDSSVGWCPVAYDPALPAPVLITGFSFVPAQHDRLSRSVCTGRMRWLRLYPTATRAPLSWSPFCGKPSMHCSVCSHCLRLRTTRAFAYHINADIQDDKVPCVLFFFFQVCFLNCSVIHHKGEGETHVHRWLQYLSQPHYSRFAEVTMIVYRTVAQSPHVNEGEMQKHWSCECVIPLCWYFILSMHIDKAVSGGPVADRHAA